MFPFIFCQNIFHIGVVLCHIGYWNIYVISICINIALQLLRVVINKIPNSSLYPNPPDPPHPQQFGHYIFNLLFLLRNALKQVLSMNYTYEYFTYTLP